MARTHYLVITAILMAITVGCASAPPPPQLPAEPAPVPQSSVPGWVDNPYVKDGFAASECVKNTPGQRSMLIKKATTLSRAEIASQIDTQVKQMTKVYQNMVGTAEGDLFQSNMENVIKVVTNQQLMGSRLTKSGYYEVEPGVQYLCVMVELDPRQTRAFYDVLMEESGNGDRIDARQEDVLYLEFKASQAQAELKEETGN